MYTTVVYLCISWRSPFTAILIIMMNFKNILALASSLGPLMCLTFDHLLCPANKAEHSCNLRTQHFHGANSCSDDRAGLQTTAEVRHDTGNSSVGGTGNRSVLTTEAPNITVVKVLVRLNCTD